MLELRLVAEEVLTNIARYGFEPGKTPAAELLFSFTDEAAVLEFRDQGRPFDPLAQPLPHLEVPLEQRTAMSTSSQSPTTRCSRTSSAWIVTGRAFSSTCSPSRTCW